MNDHDWVAERFEEHRSHLRAVAYRMLGSVSEADDAVQDAWLRLSTSDPSTIENMRAWLTTVVARVCLTMLQSRARRREDPLDVHMPDPIVSSEDGLDPEQEALLADSVGLALLVVLETLTPPERLAFVLHDMFDLPFEEIAPLVGRSATAARQLASRARRRVKGQPTVSDTDLARQRELVDAFVAAAREGDFEALLAVLDPDVVLRADAGALPGARGSRILRGAEAVARGALGFSRGASHAQRVLVNGAAGVVVLPPGGRPVAVGGITVRKGKIVAVDILADPERLRQLDLTFLSE